jgi:hypothetical protein
MRLMRLKRPLPADKADEANGGGPMRPLRPNAINGKLIVSGAIFGEAIIGEAIVRGDGTVLAGLGGNRKRIASACSGRDELGGQHADLEEIAGIRSGSNKLRR